MKYKILFLAIAIAATCAAQKSEHVRYYLGARYETEAPTGDVVFKFEKAALRRTDDGQKTWRALLTHTATYSDGDDAGARAAEPDDGRRVGIECADNGGVDLTASTRSGRSAATQRCRPPGSGERSTSRPANVRQRFWLTRRNASRSTGRL